MEEWLPGRLLHALGLSRFGELRLGPGRPALAQLPPDLGLRRLVAGRGLVVEWVRSPVRASH